MSETKKDDKKDNKRDTVSENSTSNSFLIYDSLCEECDKESYMGCSECARWICRKCGSFDKDGDFMCMGCLKHGYYVPSTWCHYCEKASGWLDMHIIDGKKMCTDCLND